MKFRRSNAERLDPQSARRQGDITRLALATLSKDEAIEFLNGESATLGARPLDLAIESEEGCARVEGELRRMTRRDEGVQRAVA